MADKRRKWSSEELKLIWKNYTETKLQQSENFQLRRWNLKEEAPCLTCGEKMQKAQYYGDQPKGKFAWDVIHLDGNQRNNDLENLQPIHPKCSLV